MAAIKLLEKGDKIRSNRNGKTLECYCIMTVYIGDSKDPVRFDYSFWDSDKKKAQTIKEPELKRKLKSNWTIQPLIRT